jgi:hypothetical protein
VGGPQDQSGRVGPDERYDLVAIASSAGGIRALSVVLGAINRRGRSITCSVVCSPLDGHGDGVVLLMEEAHRQ